MRRAVVSAESDLEQKPLHSQFSVGSDEEAETFEKAPQRPPPIRHIRDLQSQSTSTFVRVIRSVWRWFPLVILLFFTATLVVAIIPGGWRVALCACNLIPAPQWFVNEGLIIVGHRGSEFPYPENTIQAFEDAVKVTSFVEIDVALTSDEQVVVIHDSTFNRTTNGTGLICMSDLDYARSLEVLLPERNPSGQIAQAKFCTLPRGTGTIPCVYRVPLLGEVFDALPLNTSFMINVGNCYAPGIQVDTPLCSNCTKLRERISDLMAKHFINPGRVVFASTQEPSLSVFRQSMSSNSSYAFGAETRQYAHYKSSSFLDAIREYDAVNMDIHLAAMRPDLVHAVRASRTPDGTRTRHVYLWTVRHNMEYRIALCTGASRIVVAEPGRILKRFG